MFGCLAYWGKVFQVANGDVSGVCDVKGKYQYGFVSCFIGIPCNPQYTITTRHPVITSEY